MSLKLNSTDAASALASPATAGQPVEVAAGGGDMDFAALLNACTAQEPQPVLVTSQNDLRGGTSASDNTDQAQPRARRNVTDDVNASAATLALTFFPAPSLPPAETVPALTDTSGSPVALPALQTETLGQDTTASGAVEQTTQTDAFAAARAALDVEPLAPSVDTPTSQDSTTRHAPATATLAAQNTVTTVLRPVAVTAETITGQPPAAPLDQRHAAPHIAASFTVATHVDGAALADTEAATRSFSTTSKDKANVMPPVAADTAGVALPQQATSVMGTSGRLFMQDVNGSAALRRDVPLAPSPVPQDAPLQPGMAAAAPSASMVLQGSTGTGSQNTDSSSDGSAAGHGTRDNNPDSARAASDAPVSFGMGGWIGSTQAATTTVPQNEADVRPAASTGMAQLNVDRIASDGSARRLKGALQGEMMTGVQTDSFGRVHVKTSLQGDQLLSQIVLEHAPAGTMLTTHMPTLEARLNEKYGINATVHVRADAGSMSSSAGTPNDGNRSSSQGDAGRQPAPRSYTAVPGISRAAYSSTGDAQELALPVALAIPSTPGRLDITI